MHKNSTNLLNFVVILKNKLMSHDFSDDKIKWKVRIHCIIDGNSLLHWQCLLLCIWSSMLYILWSWCISDFTNLTGQVPGVWCKYREQHVQFVEKCQLSQPSAEHIGSICPYRAQLSTLSYPRALSVSFWFHSIILRRCYFHIKMW